MEKTEVVGWDTLAEQAELDNAVDPAEYPAPGDLLAGSTTGSNEGNGEENKENQEDGQRTPNSRKRGQCHPCCLSG